MQKLRQVLQFSQAREWNVIAPAGLAGRERKSEDAHRRFGGGGQKLLELVV